MTKADPRRIAENLPNWKMSKIMKLWRRAIETLADKKLKKDWGNAEAIVAIIHREWQRRRINPPRPDDYFNWPDTDAPIGPGNLSTAGWLKEGMLRYMGYQVGSTNGAPMGIRRTLLEQIFEGELPPVFEPSYLEKWGPPGSPMRLRQLAETLAAFVRNNKRRSNFSYAGAIRDWESDLNFLYDDFYVGRFSFDWPSADIAP